MLSKSLVYLISFDLILNFLFGSNFSDRFPLPVWPPVSWFIRRWSQGSPMKGPRLCPPGGYLSLSDQLGINFWGNHLRGFLSSHVSGLNLHCRTGNRERGGINIWCMGSYNWYDMNGYWCFERGWHGMLFLPTNGVKSQVVGSRYIHTKKECLAVKGENIKKNCFGRCCIRLLDRLLECVRKVWPCSSCVSLTAQKNKGEKKALKYGEATGL